MSANNSTIPCIKTTLGPTSLILEGSGKGVFLVVFRSAKKAPQNRWTKLLGGSGGQNCPRRFGEGSRRVSVLAGWSLGLASRARGEFNKLN